LKSKGFERDFLFFGGFAMPIYLVSRHIVESVEVEASTRREALEKATYANGDDKKIIKETVKFIKE
jgi:hypothetical protein